MSTKRKVEESSSSEDQNGIHVGDHIIKRISGPATLDYLVPDDESLPQFLLLGDRHFSRDHVCTSCDHNTGCYSVTDPEFYNLFATAFPDKVDMYVETFVDPQKRSFGIVENAFEGGFMQDIIVNFKKCFPHYHSYNREECPSSGVRWHSADSRESFIKQNRSIEYELASFNAPLSRGRNFDLVLNLIRALYSRRYKDYYIVINVDAFVDMFFDVIRPDNSLIAKELAKQPAEFDVTFWKKVLSYLMRQMYNNFQHNREAAIDLKFAEFEYTLSQWGVGIVSDETKQVMEALLVMFGPLLDVYMLMRVFKKTTLGKSSLVLAYLGFAHTVGISAVLQRYFGYHLVYSTDQTNRGRDKRCIVINEPLKIGDHIPRPVIQPTKTHDIKDIMSYFNSDTKVPMDFVTYHSHLNLLQNLVENLKTDGHFEWAHRLEDAYADGEELVKVLNEMEPVFAFGQKKKTRKPRKSRKSRKSRKISRKPRKPRKISRKISRKPRKISCKISRKSRKISRKPRKISHKPRKNRKSSRNII